MSSIEERHADMKHYVWCFWAFIAMGVFVALFITLLVKINDDGLPSTDPEDTYPVLYKQCLDAGGSFTFKFEKVGDYDKPNISCIKDN